jgi:hAT family C-terminal dimerisation region
VGCSNLVRAFCETTNTLHGAGQSHERDKTSSGTDTCDSINTSTSTQQEPVAKKSKLFGKYAIGQSSANATSTKSSSTVTQQLQLYLEADFAPETNLEPVSFWQTRKNTLNFDKLYMAAMRVMSVPASSSPIQRVLLSWWNYIEASQVKTF